MKILVLLLTCKLIGLTSCTNSEDSIKQEFCIVYELDQNQNYNDLISAIPEDIIELLVERPDSNGALGRNKNGYFHVRFQLDMTYLTDFAIRFQSEEAILEYLRNLQYSFSYQEVDGGFQFIAPEAFLNHPNYQAPKEGDLASGAAFFAYSLGMSLITLEQSPWYVESVALNEAKSQIEALKPNIQKLLDYLKSNIDLLYTVDANAPNRMLFNAIALFSLGTLLNDDSARNLGYDFAKNALTQRDPKIGYFIEEDGWDSSYNGVAIKLGFELFSLLSNDSEQTIKAELEQAISCATDWQKSRILSTGEISVDGNTRVYPGGEEFLGNEKGVDVIKTFKAFFYMAALSDRIEYNLLAQQVIDHYR